MHLSSILALATIAVASGGTPNQSQSGGVGQGRQRPQWGALKPGRYGVGFRLDTEYDHSRRVPDEAELERLVMVDRAVDKVASILRDRRRADSAFTLFSQQTMALYAFRFARQNDLPFAIRLLELNTEAFPKSWSAADALGDGYSKAADTTRALAAFTRALGLLTASPTGDTTSLGVPARARQAIEEKIAKLRSRSSSPGRGRPGP